MVQRLFVCAPDELFGLDRVENAKLGNEFQGSRRPLGRCCCGSSLVLAGIASRVAFGRRDITSEKAEASH